MCEILTPEEKLNVAIENFEILKDNLENFSIKEQLEMARTIRDNVVTDSCLTNECSENQVLAGQRKQLLDNINSFHKKLIEDAIKEKYKIDCDENVKVVDFHAANKALFKIAETEENSSCSNCTDELYANIIEYQNHRSTLNKLIKRGTKNEYKILLMGEYQSGKTTFIDSVIGRHIGAIGDGNTTSAVPIAISYGVNDSVSVEWKDKKHLTSLLFHIKKYIKDFSPETFDIESKTEREYLYSELDAFRRDGDCPKVKVPGLKVLALCSLVLKYYDNPKLQEFSRSTIELSFIHKISRFPEKFEQRWRKKGGDNFSFEESVFVFVERIHCFLKSEMLKQLNCTFVDSPGLFSNDYDTKVTENEMVNANAILYLLPYDKEVGEDTCGSLYILKNNYTDILRKLFIVNNRDYTDRKRFFTNNRETINGMFGPKMDLYKIDTRLAYLGMLRKTFDSGVLSNDEILHFMRSCEYEVEEYGEKVDSMRFNNFIDAWKDSLYAYIHVFRWIEIPTADEIIETSGLKKVLHNLLRFIDNNRAYSIIISEGIFKLYNEIAAIRRNLKLLYVDPYVIGDEKMRLLWQSRITRADDFEKSAKTIVRKYLFENVGQLSPLSKRLTDSVYSKVFTSDSIDKLVVRICREVYNNKWGLTKCGKNEEKISKLIAPKIESVVSDFIIERIEHWNSLIKQDQDASFSEIFVTQMRLLENELNQKWQEFFDDNDSDFSSVRDIYYKIPKDTSWFALGSSQQDDNGFSTGRVSLMGSLLNDIVMAIAAIFMLLVPTIVSIITAIASNPMGWVIGTVTVAFGAGYYCFTGDDWMETNFIRKYAPEIRNKIAEENIESKLKDYIFKEIEKILSTYATKLTLDKKRLEADRDIYISSPKEVIEHNCFTAIKEISYIDECIAKYNEFVTQYVEYAEN